jgi:hypothetical protein
MPIDASIPLQGRLPQMQMPLDVEQQRNQNALAQMQLQQGQQGMQDKNALRQLLANAGQGGPVDYGQLGKALLPYNPEAGMHMLQLKQQADQQQGWAKMQQDMLGTSQAPGPPSAQSPGQPLTPGQPPAQVSGIFSAWRDHPNPGVVNMAKQGEMLLQQGAFKDRADLNGYIQRVGELDAKYQEASRASTDRIQAAKDAAQQNFENQKALHAAIQAGQPREPMAQIVTGPDGQQYSLPRGATEAVPLTLPGGAPLSKPGAGEKPLTESQGKATGMAMRAQKSHDIINQLAAEGQSQPGWTKQVAESVGVGGLANWTQSDKQQQVEQAQRDFINAALRVESGASISASEFDNAKKQYFPQPGDSPAVIQQKQQNRVQEIEGLKAQAGSGAKNVGSSDPLTVVNPADGKSYRFPTRQQADAARRAAGIK